MANMFRRRGRNDPEELQGLLSTSQNQPSMMQKYRTQAYNILTSKNAQYTILFLVFLDLVITLSEFLVKLELCERRDSKHSTREVLEKAEKGLSISSLVFSSVFMVELCVSIWAFGLQYFKSKFHLFDSVVIIAGFLVDVVLNGVDQDIGSAVLALRLFRIVKIVEEVGNGVQEDADRSQEIIERLDSELRTLREALTVAQMHASDSHTSETRGTR